MSTLLLLWACRKEITLKESDISPKIVLNSKFLAGDTCRVHLSRSSSLLDTNYILPVIDNGTVRLLDKENNFLGNFIYESNGVYAFYDFFPTAGNVYKVEAEAVGFESVSAFSSVPTPVVVNNVDTISTGNRMEFSLSFSDNPAESNFYSIKILRRQVFTDDEGFYWDIHSTFFSTLEFFVVNGVKELTGEKNGDEFFFTDKVFNGQTINFKSFIGHIAEPDKAISFYIEFNSLSEELYKYKLTHSNYKEAGFNPFAEPVQVYSNIEKGIGVFGGYSTYQDSIFVE